MSVGFCGVRHRLIVLPVAFGICLSSPAISQPASSSAPAADFDVVEATIDGIHAAMRSGGLSCTKLVQAYLDRIAAYDQAGPKLNAVQNVNPHALKQAADLDAKFKASGAMAPLHCVPVLLKDQIETDFMPTTYGSAMFRTFVPKRNATVVERLQGAGAIILAKTNMGEFAAGGAGSAFGDCHNAYDPAYFASGSSCGTGIGVAASFGAVGIGEDTGGSVRGPAAHGSLVGLRPTTPLVSRFGMMPASPTRDTIGPIARTVKDAALLLEAIAGYDPKDPLTAASYRRTGESYTAALAPEGLRGMRLGVIRQSMDKETDTNAADYKEVRAMIDRVVGVLRMRGAEVIDPIEIPNLVPLLDGSGGTRTNIYETEQAVDAYLAQHPDAPVHTFKAMVTSPLLIEPRRQALMYDVGRLPTEPAYGLQRQTQEALRTQILKVMADNRLDAFVYATYDHAPARLPRSTTGNNRQLAPVLGYPALAVPGGFASNGLPLGFELLGLPFAEGTLFKAAYDFEQSTKVRRPPAATPALPK
jgi:Asp-tRNA(Asn)/Glu-tRNA(Gln) amidotransferase A subunit family amidase